ncbi:zinc finger MYM-type protein 1 [Trichonephila inaurata madagascariensis]|uniref:Zinc finger MYM-type protein 1 n=1 Tax=Trichonephila inaurata madagascariensis TaxID=2747483 RepID=A0A8X6XBN8_9ARAC|nr:zinc finger MYM-type protein 1 [Trichonephila inaurata madagascariensis]
MSLKKIPSGAEFRKRTAENQQKEKELKKSPEGKRGVLATGCNDWKNSFVLASQHDRSDDNTANVLIFSLRKGINTVQNAIQNQYDKKAKCWQALLTRVVSVVKFLSTRGLPFRGDDQQLESTTNGLFLECLELLSEFDQFISRHLTKYGNQGILSVD